jgi:hypothetical protein
MKNTTTHCVKELGTALNDLLCQMLYTSFVQFREDSMKKMIDNILHQFQDFPVTVLYLRDYVLPLLPQLATSLIPVFTNGVYTNQGVESYNRSAQIALDSNRATSTAEVVSKLIVHDKEFDDQVCTKKN